MDLDLDALKGLLDTSEGQKILTDTIATAMRFRDEVDIEKLCDFVIKNLGVDYHEPIRRVLTEAAGRTNIRIVKPIVQ